MAKVDLFVIEVSSGRQSSCAVTTSESPESCLVAVSWGANIARGRGYDFEMALQILRIELETLGVHLLCNRYRRNAYATSLSRQMSRGLGCYLVAPHRPVDPDAIVDCLGSADQSDVVSVEVADAFIAKWKGRPPILGLLLQIWRGWRQT